MCGRAAAHRKAPLPIALPLGFSTGGVVVGNDWFAAVAAFSGQAKHRISAKACTLSVLVITNP